MHAWANHYYFSVRMGKSSKQEVIGFYKENDQVKPITRPKDKSKKITHYVSKDTYTGGYKATLNVEVEGLKYDIPIRWETQKVDPLVETQWMAPNGKKTRMRYIGPKKRRVWMDEDGKEWKKSDLQLYQIKPDGSKEEVEEFSKTKKIEGKTYPKELMNEFMPHSFVEIWGDNTKSQNKLRHLAWKMMKKGNIIAVNKFAKRKGTKVYVAFIRPVVDNEGNFTVEMMVSENRRRRRRWMPAEEAIVGEEPKKKEDDPEVPEIFDSLRTPYRHMNFVERIKANPPKSKKEAERRWDKLQEESDTRYEGANPNTCNICGKPLVDMSDYFGISTKVCPEHGIRPIHTGRGMTIDEFRKGVEK